MADERNRRDALNNKWSVNRQKQKTFFFIVLIIATFLYLCFAIEYHALKYQFMLIRTNCYKYIFTAKAKLKIGWSTGRDLLIDIEAI